MQIYTVILEHGKGAAPTAATQSPMSQTPTPDITASMPASEMASAQALPVVMAISCSQLSWPQRFDGESGDRPFLTQCELHFQLQAASFDSECAKITFIISHLSGHAEAWAKAEWNRRSSSCASLRDFVTALEQIFQLTAPGHEEARGLTISQDKCQVSFYAIDFSTLAINSDWNGAALVDAFFHGLSDRVKDHLVASKLPVDLNELIATTIRILVFSPDEETHVRHVRDVLLTTMYH